jgi:hypothetical protein
MPANVYGSAKRRPGRGLRNASGLAGVLPCPFTTACVEDCELLVISDGPTTIHDQYVGRARNVQAAGINSSR